MAAALNISEQSATYLVAHLCASGAISMRIYQAEPAS